MAPSTTMTPTRVWPETWRNVIATSSLAHVLCNDVPMRCFGDGDPLYEAYHDNEWGRPVHGDIALLERLVLEGFQSGLSWLTILRKRESFRRAFVGFDPQAVAAFGEDDVLRLLDDASIVRHRRKIEAAITNAQIVYRMQSAGESLDELFWSFAPPPRPESQRPRTPADFVLPPEATALAKTLKSRGFVFVGPTTVYAAMQACGLVDDHMAGCQAIA
jgi:DNA-3-methyladenine glycosylase I